MSIKVISVHNMVIIFTNYPWFLHLLFAITTTDELYKISTVVLFLLGVDFTR